MPGMDEIQQSAELRQAFLRHLPKRLDGVRRRGRRLCNVGWDINALALLYDELQLLAGNCGSHGLIDLSEKNRHTRDFTLNSLRSSIIEVIAAFPVYRTYTNTWTVTDRDRQVIEIAVNRAKRLNPAISTSIFDYLKDVLMLRFPPDASDGEKASWLDFVMRFQQIT